MITTSHKKSHLSAAQELAIASLVSGATDQEAANAAAVTRETVSRWKNRDPHFQAELNRRQKSIWEGHKMKLLGVVSAAIETIKEAVKNNPAIALKLLEKCQGLNEIEPPTGPTSAEEILLAMARELAEQERASKRQEESKGEFFITDPFEDARELAPMIKRHFSSLKKKYGLEK
jgi:hypothetical protein